MTVSIITPAYNAEEYIVETIESVLAAARSLQDFEYIVLDDGSKDATAEKIAQYQGRLQFISHANMGEPATVNKGVQLAKHDIVAIVNADDPIYPGLIEKAVAALTQDKNLAAVYPDWHKIDSEGKILEEVLTLEYDYNTILEQYRCIPGPGTFFRKSALRGEVPRNVALTYSSDFDLWVRLGLHGKMKRIPETLATWRYHEEGGSQRSRGQVMADNRVQVMEIFFKRKDLPIAIRSKKRQALSAAYYNAALLAIHNPLVSGRRFLLKSFFYQWKWPRSFTKLENRNWRYMVYILGSPMTRWIYPLVKKWSLKNSMVFKNRAVNS